jgi:hypothetical protein
MCSVRAKVAVSPRTSSRTPRAEFDESYQQFEQRIKAEMEEELGPGPIRVISAEQYKALRDRVMESV